jgi:hypothetical protein
LFGYNTSSVRIGKLCHVRETLKSQNWRYFFALLCQSSAPFFQR